MDILPTIRFVQAVNYHVGRRRQLRCITIHTMETPEQSTRAEWCANWFGGLIGTAPQASAHYMIDNDTIVQGVSDDDTAWTTPGVNADGLSVEHAGYAGQTDSQWDDAFSVAQLDLSARLVAVKCVLYGIPPRHLTDAQLAAGESGIIGHDQATRVYKLSTHTDPGENFPWVDYIDLVQSYVSVITGGDDIVTPEDIKAIVDGVLGTPFGGTDTDPARNLRQRVSAIGIDSKRSRDLSAQAVTKLDALPGVIRQATADALGAADLAITVDSDALSQAITGRVLDGLAGRLQQ